MSTPVLRDHWIPEPQPSSSLLAYVLVDVFTQTPLEGNQLAVFLTAYELAPSTMQAVAREMNLSETTFLLPPSHGGDARVRIFTPSMELPFAGHPVLGSSVVVAAATGKRDLLMETDAGPVPVTFPGAASDPATGWMTQPTPTWAPHPRVAELFDALGIAESVLPTTTYQNGPRYTYIGVGAEAELRSLRPDFSRVAALGEGGIYCFAPSSDGKWRARMFAPADGIFEDPATGAAAGPFAVHLARHGLIRFGDVIQIIQGVELGRPSVLYASVSGSSEQLGEVKVGGSAVVIGHGSLFLPATV